ncbi:RNA polymerase sigma factor [Desulfogranum japonicum]|uniref:RNA polymerase sigma factor n=1 Tax=Desulfogranum japonicum TaxID=231447 RepID=UPI0004911D16|nr:RNA polymerase sigma factor [Desulfogranum japonicum]
MDKFRAFYLENGGRLYHFLLRKSCNSHVANDLVQESFTRYLEKYKNRELSLALLFTIGRNLFHDYIRLQKHDASLDVEPVEPASDQEKKYIEKEEARRVLDAMKQLSPEERDILALVVSSGLSYADIAAIHQCSETNIKVKVHRARKKLRQLLT